MVEHRVSHELYPLGLHRLLFVGVVFMKKKLIPNVKEILTMVDEKIKFKDLGGPVSPEQARARYAEKKRKLKEKAQKAFFTDFTSITLGDYINAIHAFNRESASASMDPQQRAAYFAFFAYEESLKRLDKQYEQVN